MRNPVGWRACRCREDRPTEVNPCVQIIRGVSKRGWAWAKAATPRMAWGMAYVRITATVEETLIRVLMRR
jgi:hypothetical protein